MPYDANPTNSSRAAKWWRVVGLVIASVAEVEVAAEAAVVAADRSDPAAADQVAAAEVVAVAVVADRSDPAVVEEVAAVVVAAVVATAPRRWVLFPSRALLKRISLAR